MLSVRILRRSKPPETFGDFTSSARQITNAIPERANINTANPSQQNTHIIKKQRKYIAAYAVQKLKKALFAEVK